MTTEADAGKTDFPVALTHPKSSNFQQLWQFYFDFSPLKFWLFGLWDLSFPTRDWTPGHHSESTES